MTIAPIKTDAEHVAAMQEIEELWEAEAGTDAFNRLNMLATLVHAYEAERWPANA